MRSLLTLIALTCMPASVTRFQTKANCADAEDASHAAIARPHEHRRAPGPKP
jgi:hypothetical protein